MKKHIARVEFTRSSFDESEVLDDPYAQFSRWWHDAIEAKLSQIDAITLATVDENNHPDARIALLKDFDARGFVFFTNYESAKATQLLAKPIAAINIFWPDLERQIRMRGLVQKTSADESAKYFRSRPRGAQLSAWASPQSKAIESRAFLDELIATKEQEFHNLDIPCPRNWGGFRLVPNYFEFWQGRKNRLHDRFAFSLDTHNFWHKQRLAP